LLDSILQVLAAIYADSAVRACIRMDEAVLFAVCATERVAGWSIKPGITADIASVH